MATAGRPSRRPAGYQPPPLPESFVFGVANSDHQCEAYDPGNEDIRDLWERLQGLTMRGRATDFRQRFREDIRLAQELGCKAFRFSIAWSRFETRPGRFDDTSFAFYVELAEAVRAAGMEPVVTLHHFTWPLHVEERGGMIAPDFPAWFARYAGEAAIRLGRRVRMWLTFNEPNQLVYGYIKPWWEANYPAPPGLPAGASFDDQIEAVARLIRNLFLAHTEARRLIKRFSPEAQVGVNPVLIGVPDWLQRLVNRAIGRISSHGELRAQGLRLSHRPFAERGDVDVTIATLQPTADLARQVLLSEPYFVTDQRLLVRADSPIVALSELPGRSVAAIKGSRAESIARGNLPGIRLRLVADHRAGLRAVEQGAADAFLAEEVVLHELTAQTPGRFRLVGPRLATDAYAAAVAPGNDDLLQVVERALRRFKASGAWHTSCVRHLSQPPPQPPPIRIRSLHDTPGLRGQFKPAAFKPAVMPGGPLPLAEPGTAVRRIQDRGYVLVAASDDVPGFSYRDPQTGEQQGLEIDLAMEIAREIFGDPNRVRVRLASAGQRVLLLRSFFRFLDPLLKAYSTLSALVLGNWWHLGMAGRLTEYLCPPECVGQQDFVGMDYYWGIAGLRLHRVQALLDAAAGRFDRAPVWPPGMYGAIKEHARLFPNMPIWIMENGSVVQADGIERPAYLRRHVAQVQRAVAEGCNVAAYLCWSLTSNREWGLPFGPGNDFGLYYIDLDNDIELQRVATPSVETYRRIIAHRGVTDEKGG